MNLKNLSRYATVDIEKTRLVQAALEKEDIVEIRNYLMKADVCFDAAPAVALTKFCPKCRKKYPESENFCLECAESLKEIRDVNVKDIEIKPKFICRGSRTLNDFGQILSDENLEMIASADFDINKIALKIKRSALRRLDKTIKENDILLSELKILDKIILFAKSFVEMEYKSYGPELGIYQFNRIYIDDRQLDVLQITTLIHELTHFLVKEILTQILCVMLDSKKTTELESVVTFIMSYSPLNQLVDEYAAHTVEGRFTLYGYQDYSSFLSIEKTIDIGREDIEMLKTIGNSFANVIKNILESFINDKLLGEIKDKFRAEIMDRPDYTNLRLENCTLLNNEGFKQAIILILAEGFAVAMDNIETLESYNKMW